MGKHMNYGAKPGKSKSSDKPKGEKAVASMSNAKGNLGMAGKRMGR